MVLSEIKKPLHHEDRPGLVPGPGEVLVEIRAAALNRRDYWITQGMYPGVQPPVILGSDAAGVVTTAGDEAGQDWVGRDVVINPGFDWGGDPGSQGSDFAILASPRDGTFASEVVVPVAQLFERPQHLSWSDAAALPLAGVTAWRALFTQGRLAAGETVLITGIGGGVATFAMQWAVAAGARVFVTSSSADKIERAIAAGAAGGVNYKDENWSKTLQADAGSPNLIVDSAGGAGYRDLVSIAAPGGRIVNYGATTGPPEKLDLFKVFWKQLLLIGTTMGSPADFAAMHAFVTQHQLVPIVDEVAPLEDVNRLLDRMQTSPQFGKYVLSISDS